MSKLKMNCGYCGRKCDLDKDFCIPQDSVYVCKSCYEWQNRVADLEAKLAESEKDRDVWKSMAKCGDKLTEKMRDEYQQLKQQLAEKDKELEEVKQHRTQILNFGKRTKKVVIVNPYGEDCVVYNQEDQDKISFAVEQLEKVKENLINFPAVTNEDIKILKKKQKEHFDKRLMDFCKHNLNFIDNQINVLRNNKDGIH